MRKRAVETSAAALQRSSRFFAAAWCLNGAAALRQRLWRGRRGSRAHRRRLCCAASIVLPVALLGCLAWLGKLTWTHVFQEWSSRGAHHGLRPGVSPACPLADAVVVPAERDAATPVEAAFSLLVEAIASADDLGPASPSPLPTSLSYAFAAPQGLRHGASTGERLDSVAALSAHCAARVREVPSWSAASWWQPAARSGAVAGLSASRFDVHAAPTQLGAFNYTATASAVCLRGGRVYLPAERLDAPPGARFRAAGLSVHALTDEVLRQRTTPVASPTREQGARDTGPLVVPAMAVLLHGTWIATHFFHLMTDALEALQSAYATWQGGVLQRIPTQTVLLSAPGSNWVDRRGDSLRKLEMSAAVANAFSSPQLGCGSPFNTSFVFRIDPPQCARQERDAARGTALCFCDALLAPTRRFPVLEAGRFYGVQDWAARQFRSAPYAHNRSARALDQLRLTLAALQPPGLAAWAAGLWPAAAQSASTVPTGSPLASAPSYRPRVLFVHRTTRQIANATRYAQWMREAGFRVEEAQLETLSAAQQYHLGRYADVVVGMHGLGIGHALWMERSPPRCRTVIEFRPWVISSMPTQPLLILGHAMRYHFVTVAPTDVRFGPSVQDPLQERARMMSPERMVNAFDFPGFTDQVASYDDDKVRQVFADVRRHLAQCLPL